MSGKPAQFLRLNYPLGAVNVPYDGEWPPPEFVDALGDVFKRVRYSKLDAATVTDSHVARGAEYEPVEATQ